MKIVQLCLVSVSFEHRHVFSVKLQLLSIPSVRDLSSWRSFSQTFSGQRRRNVFDLSGGSLTEVQKTVKGCYPKRIHREQTNKLSLFLAKILFDLKKKSSSKLHHLFHVNNRVLLLVLQFGTAKQEVSHLRQDLIHLDYHQRI